MPPDDTTSETNATDRWGWLKREALAVIGVAGSLTAALWLKRIVDRLAQSQIIDPAVVQRGLKPEAPTTTSSTYATPSVYRSSVFTSRIEGPGRVLVDGVGAIPYRQIVHTPDGYKLYDHNTQLNEFHIAACPLLLADRLCDRCTWSYDGGPYSFDHKCIAVEKIKQDPRGDLSLSEIKRMVEAQGR